MKKTKALLIMSIIFIFLILSLCTNSYAASVSVTEEKLKQVFEEWDNDEGKIFVSNNVIKLNIENEIYSLKYDLNENPTFYVESEIKQGMKYEEYEKQNGIAILPIFGYIAVAHIQGVELEDSATYIMMSMLADVSDMMFSSKDGYIIIDDINHDYTGEKSDDSKVIYASEFGDRVMEVMNYTYKNPQVITDSNTYTFTTIQKDVTDKSCKLVTSLTVNLSGNFEEIKGAKNKIESDLEESFENLEESFKNAIEASKNTLEEMKKEEQLSQGNISINIGGNSTLKDNEQTVQKTERELEKEALKEIEKEYRAKRNKIPNAGDITIKVLRTIIITLVIALITIIAFSRKRKV